MSLRPYSNRIYIRAMLTWILVSCGSISIAQNTAPGNNEDTAYLKKRIQEVFTHLNGSPDSSIAELAKILKASQKIGYKRGTYYCYTISASAYYLKNDFETATLCSRKAPPYCSSVGDSMNIYYNIANCYYAAGDYKKSGENCYIVLDLSTRAHDRRTQKALISAYMCLSALNKELRQPVLSAKYASSAEHVARKDKFYEELVTIVTNKALSLWEAGNKDSASICLQEAISICEENDLEGLEGQVYEELGNVSLESGMYEKAIGYFKQAVDPKKCKDDYYTILVYSSFGTARALYKLQRYGEAEIQALATIRAGKEHNINPNVANEYRLLSDIYRSAGKWQKALYYLDTATTLKDSLTGAEKTAALNLMEVKYKSSEKDKKLSENQLMIAQQQKLLDRKNILMLSVTAGILLLLAVGISVYLQLINRQRMREKESRIQILKAAMEGSDNERSRIARELHDGVGGMLGASMIRFKAMRYEHPEFAQTEVYKDAMNILQDVGEEIRKAAHNLMPELLMKESLPDAIKSFCDKVQENGAFRLDFQSYGDFGSLPATDKLNLYRIVQELVKNAVSHSSATKVLVQLIHNTEGTVVSVEDNGIGFDTNEKHAGMGLPNIQTRVISMGGRLTIESLRGKGTTAIIEIPAT